MALVLAWAVMTGPYAWVLICDSREVPAGRDGDAAAIGKIGSVPGGRLRCDVGSGYP